MYAYGVLTPLLTVAFFAIYGGADFVTGLHDYRVRLHMDWEVQLPLVRLLQSLPAQAWM